MRVLIIEDNVALSLNMKKGLEGYGFFVDVANDGTTGEDKIYCNEYDVVLLDLNLPDKDGIEILQFLRKETINVPVLIVSARDDVMQRTQGLDAGADDYIVKPFQMVELRARIQAVIRRYHGRSDPLIKVGEMVIDPGARRVHIKDKQLELAAKEFDILEYIASKHPTVISAEELIEHVYDEDYNPFSSVLRVHLARLRKKLSAACGYEVLLNIRGKGYYLCEK